MATNAAEEQAKAAVAAEQSRYLMYMEGLEAEMQQEKDDRDLFILYKSEAEIQQKQEEEELSMKQDNEMDPKTSSIAKTIIYSDISSIFGDMLMSHDALQKLSRKFDLLQIETKKRALHEVVKCIKLPTFTEIWNVWSRSMEGSIPYSLMQIAFKYYEYCGMLCSWTKKEKMIDRYPGGYDEYTNYSLWCIYSDGKMYEKLDATSSHIERTHLNKCKDFSEKKTELLISHLICYQLCHYKERHKFKNYGKQIAAFYGLDIAHYKYDRYKMGMELFLFFKNELKIDFPNNFV